LVVGGVDVAVVVAVGGECLAVLWEQFAPDDVVGGVDLAVVVIVPGQSATASVTAVGA
jgi:hypothetical protein